MSSSPIELLLAHWRTRHVELNRGATESEIVEVERMLGARLPADMRAFYRRVNGMARDTTDDLMFSLWPLEVMQAARAEGRVRDPRDAAALAFGDFLIDSHFYAVTLKGVDVGSVAVVWPDGSLERVAESFESFLAQYWTAPERLYMFDRPLVSGA